MLIRPVQNEHDLTRIQKLYDDSYPTPVPNASAIIESQHVRVAAADNGAAVGFYALSPAGFVWLAVDADHRRQGIGRLLMEDALAEAARRDFGELTSKVLESASGRAFFEQFGFKPYVHAVNLALDLADFDESPLIPKLAQAQAAGITFTTFDKLGDTEGNRRRMYALNRALAATIPRDEVQPFANFETYVERRISNPIMPHAGIRIALAGDQWVGMSQVSLENGYSFQQMTGVLPEYRGRGIAQALKLLSMRFVRESGQTVVYTFNDVGNTPMIAVNENVGFRRAERFYLVRRKPA